MHIIDAGFILDGGTRDIASDSFWFSDHQRQFKPVLGTVPGSPAIGDHGEQWSADPLQEAKHEAILECGCKLLFPMPPMTGEELYCSRHQSWSPCRVIGSFAYRCDTCDYPETPAVHRVAAYTWARKHAYGSRVKRKTAHVVYIGKYTEESVAWTKYTKEGN